MSHLMRVPYPDSVQLPEVIGGTAVFYSFPSQSQSIAIPAGYEAGDLLCLYVITRGYSATASADFTISTSGWTNVSSQHNSSANGGIYTYYKIGDTGEGNPTVAFASIYHCRVVLVCYRNASVLQNPRSSLVYDASSPFVIASRAVSSPGLIVLVGMGFRLNVQTAPGAPTITPSPLSGATFDTSNAGTGWVAHVEAATATTYGQWTVSFATSSSSLVANVLEIR